MGKRKVEVSLVGQPFTVRSENDEAHVHAIANFVNRRFEELQHSTRTKSTHEVALLLALNLADELFDAEKRVSTLRNVVKDRAAKVLGNIESALELVGHPEDGAESSEVAAAVQAPAVERAR